MNPVNRLSRALAARSLPRSGWKESKCLAFTPGQQSQLGLTSHATDALRISNIGVSITTHRAGLGNTKGLMLVTYPCYPMQRAA